MAFSAKVLEAPLHRHEFDFLSHERLPPSNIWDGPLFGYLRIYRGARRRKQPYGGSPLSGECYKDNTVFYPKLIYYCYYPNKNNLGFLTSLFLSFSNEPLEKIVPSSFSVPKLS